MKLTDYLLMVDRLNRHAHFNGIMQVISPTRSLYAYAGGLADIERKVPFTAGTVTGIGSLSKQFLAVAVMQQVAAGRVHLTDRLSDYVPEYPAGSQATLADLLTMSSGIPDYPTLLQKQHPTDAALETNPQSVRRLGAALSLPELITLLANQPLKFTPGSQSAYSNTNYVLLGSVLARVLKKPLGQVLADNLWTPLGLSATRLGTQHAQAISYLPWHDELVFVGRGQHTAADSGIVTSATDYAQWLRAVLTRSDRLLPAAAWDQIFTIRHNFYGMGWFRHGPWYWHSGLIFGYQADAFLSFDRQLAVFWFTNVRFLTASAKDWNRKQWEWLDGLTS